MKSIQIKTVNLFIAATSCLMIGASPQNPTKECVNSQSGDLDFGFSVAVNDQYLAVGDPNANKVAIYTRDNSGKWSRTKELSPPQDSVPDRVDSGFGRDLQLDGDVLVINATTDRAYKEVTNLEIFQARSSRNSVFHGRYLIRLDSETEVEAINLPIEKKEGLVQFNVLSEGEIKQITLPDSVDIKFNKYEGFNYSFAFDNNLLLVGSFSYPSKGAWLFDIDKLEKKTLKLTTPNAFLGTAVALNEEFAVVGSILLGEPIYDLISPPKTLIRALDSGSTTVIDSYGELSLSGNTLAVMRFGSFNREQTPLLQVFRLDNNAKPHLIIEREYPVERAWVQNGFLVTVEPHFDINVKPMNHTKVCLEPVN